MITRLLTVTLLLTSVIPAGADDPTDLRDKLLSCVRFPASAVDLRLKATFKASGNREGKPTSLGVMSFTPNSKAAAKSAQELAREVRKCWPRNAYIVTIDLTNAF